jgi:hypothetical protein
VSAPLSDASVRRTRWAAFALLAWLAALVLGSGFAAAVLLSVAEDYAHSAGFQIVLCMTGGTLGASLLALLSAGERIARGWSFADDALARGERRFHARLAPLLALQPILGAAVGMLLLLALSAGSVMLLRLSEGTTFDPMGLLLAAAFAGLLSRALLARLRDAADALLGARATPSAAADAPLLASGTVPIVAAVAASEALPALAEPLTAAIEPIAAAAPAADGVSPPVPAAARPAPAASEAVAHPVGEAAAALAMPAR